MHSSRVQRMKAGDLLRLCAFIAGFAGIVAFYVLYGKQSVLDSVFFVVLTVSTVGYDDDIAPTIAIRLFTVFTMLFGILFLFTYIKNIVHNVGKLLKRKVLPTLSLHHYVGGLVIVSFSSLFVILAVGTVFVYYNEGLHFVDALYFIVYTATTVGYGGVPIHFHSTKIFLIFYVLIAPILLAISFDSILSLPMRIRRKRLITDILLNRMLLTEVMVDLEKQQQRVHRWRHQQRQQRLRHRPLLQRFVSSREVRRNGIRKSSVDNRSNNSADGSARVTLRTHTLHPAPCSGFYHPEPCNNLGGSTNNRHDSEVYEEKKGDDIEVDVAIDPELQVEEPQYQGQQQQQQHQDSPEDHSEHSDSDTSDVLFGNIRHEHPTETGLFGLDDGASVSKYEFVLSVLLYLGKIQYEKDVYIWGKEFDQLDVRGKGSVIKEELQEVYMSATCDEFA